MFSSDIPLPLSWVSWLFLVRVKGTKIVIRRTDRHSARIVINGLSGEHSYLFLFRAISWNFKYFFIFYSVLYVPGTDTNHSWPTTPGVVKTDKRRTDTRVWCEAVGGLTTRLSLQLLSPVGHTRSEIEDRRVCRSLSRPIHGNDELTTGSALTVVHRGPRGDRNTGRTTPPGGRRDTSLIYEQGRGGRGSSLDPPPFTHSTDSFSLRIPDGSVQSQPVDLGTVPGLLVEESPPCT